MKPISLTISNFMNHRDSKIVFGSMKSALIVGKTKADDLVSNGVGKSTIFSAIEWVIYNKVHKKTLEKVVRDGQKRCLVEYEFELDNSTYKIHRTLSSKGTKNVYLYELINGEWQSITQRTPSETEEKLQSIIKLSYKAFQYCVLFRQADLSGLVEDEAGTEISSKKRMEILKELFNIGRYSKKEDMTKKLAEPIKKEIDAKEASAKLLGTPEQDIKAINEEIENCVTQLGGKEKSKSEIEVALEEKRKSLQQLKSTLSSSDADIHDRVEDYHLRVKKLNHSIKELGESHKKTLATIESQTTLLSGRRDKLNELNETLAAKELESHRELVKISSDLKRVSDDEMKGTSLIAKAESDYEHAKNSIPDSDHCPACKQSITSEYRHNFEEEIKKVLEKKQEDIDFYKKALTKCRAAKSKYQKELDTAKEYESFMKTLRSSVKTAQDNISVYEENIKNAEVESKRIERDLDAQTTQLQESIKHYNTLKELAERSDLADLNTKIFSVSREIKIYEQSLESMRTEIQNLKTREGVLSERLKNRTKDKDRLDIISNELLALRKEYAIHQRVMNSFSYKGIPTLIVNTYLNELQLETNKTLQELRPDLEVQFDAELNFTFRRNGVEKDYQQLSYGQHVYVALSFKRALARVVQRRALVSINLMEFDEVDSAIDKAGVAALAAAIKRWQEEFTILVVTHNDSLKDKFSHAILVEEGDDGSTASVVTSW